jgi:peptidoglycan/xylan/chitin deacetylase (PgdA/CDA1 family)
LTFHGAGDLALARQVLDLLGKRGARVTVLAVGTWLTESPDAAKLVVDGGHELGNHTWSHPALSGYSPEPMYAEIQRCRDKLVELTGSPGAFFRQSQGQHATRGELEQAGRAGYARVLSYDVDSLDWRDPGAAAIRSAVATAKAGSVVSMHLGHPGTLAALPGILTDLTGRGLTPVTASELLT